MSSFSSAKTPFFLLSLVAAILDQLSKQEILKHFTEGGRLNIIPSFFDPTLAHDPGATFSFLTDQGGRQKFFFSGLTVVISLYLARTIWRDEFDRWSKLGAAMIIGGAIGNVVNHLIHGHIVDFLLFYWQSWFYPVFNIADSFICVDVVRLILDGLLHRKASSNDTRTV